jgi:hypothetical protein
VADRLEREPVTVEDCRFVDVLVAELRTHSTPRERTPSGYGRIQACTQHLLGPRCNSRSVDVGEPRTRAPSRRVNSRSDVRRTIYVTARSALTPCG